jgi:hypothetical protein
MSDKSITVIYHAVYLWLYCKGFTKFHVFDGPSGKNVGPR